MQWTDLYIATAGMKVACRLTSAGDLRSFSGTVAIGPDADVLPALADQVTRWAGQAEAWVSTTPMPETVKDVDADGLVRATVPREELAIAGYPIVAESTLLDGADPEELLRNLLERAGPLNSLPA